MTNDYFFALPLLVVVSLIAIFAWIYQRKERRHPAEAAMRPLFTEDCAGVIGWVTYKGPFIRLAVYPDFLVASCDQPYYLPFTQISQVERRSFLFSKGYRIHHRNPQYPRRIEVWFSNRESFEAAIGGKVTIV